MSSRERFVLEGIWRGYRSSQDHVVHREVCSKAKAGWANETFCIHFTDGTTLELRARKCHPRERIEARPGYKSLIEDCYYRGVNSVAQLYEKAGPA